MLTFNALDIYGNEIVLPIPSYMTLNRDEGVPADDISISFPVIKDLPELCELTIREESEIIFYGQVDEQQTVVSSSAVLTRIVARSMAAVLLDNESKPVSYYCPSTSIVFSRHLEPFNITSYKGNDVVLKETLNIAKGMTNWQALYTFCMRAYGKPPRIEADGTVNLNGIECDKSVYFSNVDGVHYISLKENNKRCNTLSDVWVKLSAGDGYVLNVINEDAKARKIKRERYLDATSASASPIVAQTMIRNSVDNSYELIVVSPERLVNVLGASAIVDDSYIGRRENLYVSNIYYNLTPDGERTTVTLKRRQENVDT
ncbi:MAG: hypothetical protein J1E96_07390 [Ruminococcus sp.]|nr:hypothetical protein [Ruminococcus sp.]